LNCCCLNAIFISNLATGLYPAGSVRIALAWRLRHGGVRGEAPVRERSGPSPWWRRAVRRETGYQENLPQAMQVIGFPVGCFFSYTPGRGGYNSRMTSAEKTSQRYQQLQLRWRLISLAAFGALVIAFMPAEKYLLFPSIGGTFFSSEPLFYAVLMAVLAGLVYLAVMAPIEYHASYTLRRRFGLASERPGQAVWRVIKSLSLHYVLVLLLILAILGVYYLHPAGWLGWEAGIFLLVVPLLELCLRKPPKLFGLASKAMDDESLPLLRNFAKAHGVENMRFFLLPMSRLGREVYAGVSSRLGRPCFYFSDTLLERMVPPELLAVFAHELGHHRHHHTLWSVLIWMAGYAVMLICLKPLLEWMIPNPADAWQVIRAAPGVLAATWLIFMLLRPLMLYLSRRHERAANEWALRATGDSDAFVAAMKKLAESNLGAPGRAGIIEKLLFATHPSLKEIIDQANCFAAGHDIRAP